MKAALVASNTDRLARIERGETTVVGVNRYQETEPSPLTAGEGMRITAQIARVETDQVHEASGGTHQPSAIGDFAYNTRVDSYFEWVASVIGVE